MPKYGKISSSRSLKIVVAKPFSIEKEASFSFAACTDD